MNHKRPKSTFHKPNKTFDNQNFDQALNLEENYLCETVPQPLMMINSETNTSIDPFSQRPELTEIYLKNTTRMNNDLINFIYDKIKEILKEQKIPFMQDSKLSQKLFENTINSIRELLRKQHKEIRKYDFENETKNKIILKLNHELNKTRHKYKKLKSKFQNAKQEYEMQIANQSKLRESSLSILEQKQYEIDNLNNKLAEINNLFVENNFHEQIHSKITKLSKKLELSDKKPNEDLVKNIEFLNTKETTLSNFSECDSENNKNLQAKIDCLIVENEQLKEKLSKNSTQNFAEDVFCIKYTK